MIIKREWESGGIPGLRKYYNEGWFLLGIIPLYIRKTPIRYRLF